MTPIDFYRLSRAVQESLLDSLRGQFAPVPILVRRGPRPLVLMWLAASIAAAILLTVVWAMGFGDVESALALEPVPISIVYALLVATIVVGLLNAAVSRTRERTLPFAPGVYVFPANLIDARQYTLRVHPLEELSSVSPGPRGTVVLGFGISRFSFPVPDGAGVEETIEMVEKARDHMKTEIDAQERRKLDPLAPPSVASPLTPQIPLTRKPPRWESQRWIIGIAFGTVVGVGLFFVRNAMSDAKMFASVRARDDIGTYRAYLARGKRNREVVSKVLLPRAELRVAVANGSVDVLDAFLRDHPDTGIQSEIDAARRGALFAEFERTRKDATFAAVFTFADRHPNHGVGPAFDQTKRLLYARALERYRTGISEGPSEFVARLVAYSERTGARKTPEGFRGPTVTVRFRRLPSEHMDLAEAVVTRSPMSNGPTSLPTRYLDAARLDPNEAAGARALVEGFGRAFDPEVLTFEAGPSIPGSGELPQMTAPTLVVSYRIEASGTAYASKSPRGIFMGLSFAFKSEFILPGDANPLRTKQTVSERVPIDRIKQHGGAAAPGALEAEVYDVMTRDAFSEFPRRYLEKWSPKADSK